MTSTSSQGEEPTSAGPVFEEGTPRGLPQDADGNEATLIVDLDGFEGPLDVLLVLARSQKVDLTRISILQLAEQYLDFINKASRLELDLAADYLVMASWLAYLKSRLLLPPPDVEEGPSGAEMAARLAFQLQRLESMRHAAQKLFGRQRLGVQLFSRGAPEGIRVKRTSTYEAILYDLLKAYSDQRLTTHLDHWEPKQLPVMPIEAARKRLEDMLGMMFDWDRIDTYLPTEHMSGEVRRSALASTFSASLVLAKEGTVELRQTGHYQPLYVRRKPSDLAPAMGNEMPPSGAANDQQT